MSLKERFQSLNQRYSIVQSRELFIKGSIESILSDTKRYKKNIEELTEEIAVQQETVTSYKEVLDILSKEQIIKIQSLVTVALHTIFHDRDYSLDIVFGERGLERTVELVLVEKRRFETSAGEEDVELRTPFEDGIGGGVMVVVGFLLQVYFIVYFDLEKVMFCDESFSQLSDIYLPNLLEFIKSLCEQKGFRIVLISHDPRITANADFVYQMEDGVVTRVKGVSRGGRA